MIEEPRCLADAVRKTYRIRMKDLMYATSLDYSSSSVDSLGSGNAFDMLKVVHNRGAAPKSKG